MRPVLCPRHADLALNEILYCDLKPALTLLLTAAALAATSSAMSSERPTVLFC